MTEIDHYTQCETGLIARLRTLTEFFPKDFQVATDDSVLSNGAGYFAILFPGPFPSTRANGRQAFFNWVVNLDLYVRYSTRKESLGKFKAVRAALVNLLQKPNSLASVPGVTNTVLSAVSELQQDAPGDNPDFIIQTMAVTITQLVTFNI